MGPSGRGTETLLRESARDDARARTSLSVCCMTSGRRPGLLAGVLAPLREIATEIVVAVEAPRAAEAHAALAGLVDTVLAFPPTAPADRPIAWLFRRCAGRWILNVDDDEVPSPALVEALPELVRRDDITHAWIARRWLYPTRNTFVASAPWGTEFQLRLVLADERFLQFSDVFHRPVVASGPSTYVDAPLWHLDTILNPAALRRRKAEAYERERAGMRIGGLAHNLGLYVPELYEGLELADVPPADRRAIATVQAFRGPSTAGIDTVFTELPAEDVDREWVGPPYEQELYRAELELRSPPHALVAGRQATVDVRVTNRSGRVWRWGADARPPVLLAYRWRRDGQDVADELALRTTLPSDLPPDASELVPVHVVAPVEPGRYELEVDLVHGTRRFGAGASAELEIRAGRSIAVIARPDRLPELARELALPPDVELVALLRDAADRHAYADYRSVVGLRPYLLAGMAGRGRIRTLAALFVRVVVVALRSGGHWSRPAYRDLLAVRRSSEGLIVDSTNWEESAAFGREWAWVAATALLWRLEGRQALMRRAAVPGGFQPSRAGSANRVACGGATRALACSAA